MRVQEVRMAEQSKYTATGQTEPVIDKHARKDAIDARISSGSGAPMRQTMRSAHTPIASNVRNPVLFFALASAPYHRRLFSCPISSANMRSGDTVGLHT